MNKKIIIIIVSVAVLISAIGVVYTINDNKTQSLVLPEPFFGSTILLDDQRGDEDFVSIYSQQDMELCVAEFDKLIEIAKNKLSKYEDDCSKRDENNLCSEPESMEIIIGNMVTDVFKPCVNMSDAEFEGLKYYIVQEYKKEMNRQKIINDLPSDAVTKTVKPVVSTNIEFKELVIDTITPDKSGRDPPPGRTILSDHGNRISFTNNNASLNNPNTIKMNGESVQLIDMRNKKGHVFEYYSSDSSPGDNTKLTTFMESGGVIVKTSTLRNATEFYGILANNEETKDTWFVANGILAWGNEAHNRIIPTVLDLYTDDGKGISIWTYASLEDTIKIAKKLKTQSGLIDLNDYVDPNWTDG